MQRVKTDSERVEAGGRGGKASQGEKTRRFQGAGVGRIDGEISGDTRSKLQGTFRTCWEARGLSGVATQASPVLLGRKIRGSLEERSGTRGCSDRRRGRAAKAGRAGARNNSLG